VIEKETTVDCIIGQSTPGHMELSDAPEKIPQ